MSPAAQAEEETRCVRILSLALASLERVDCQFWACDGPTMEPVGMKTCHLCATTAEGRQELGLDPVAPLGTYIGQLEEMAEA